MKLELTKAELWNQAGMAGLALGLVPTAHMFITQHISEISSGFMLTFVTFLLWGVKFGGCIWLMFHFMQKLKDTYKGLTHKDLMFFGMAMSICSALFYSGMALANILVISPDIYESAFETAMQSYRTLLDSNSMAMMEKIQGNFPQITFFSNLIYCFLYGCILSAILSRAVFAKIIIEELREIEEQRQNEE